MALPALGTAAPAISSQGEGTGGLGRLHRAHPEGDLAPGSGGAEERPRRQGLQRRQLVDGHGSGGAPAMGKRAGETRRSVGKVMVVARGGGGLGFNRI